MITKPRQNDYTPVELREIVIQSIRQNLPDVTQSQLADILNLARPSIARIEKRIKRKSVADKVLHNLAIKAVKENLKRIESKTVQQRVTNKGEIVDITVSEKPSFSNQLDAARLVLDRAEPIKQADSGQGNTISFTQVNVNSAYINSRQDKPIEIEAEVEGDSEE